MKNLGGGKNKVQKQEDTWRYNDVGKLFRVFCVGVADLQLHSLFFCF